MDERTIAAPDATGASPADLNAPPRRVSPALRLLSEDGRLIGRRPAVLAAGLASRLRLLRGHALWPGAEAPIFGIEPAAPRSATWMRSVLEPAAPSSARGGLGVAIRGRLGAATWSCLRAGGFLTGRPPAWLLELCGGLLHPDAPDSSPAFFSR